MRNEKPKIKKPLYKRIIKILLKVVLIFFALLIVIGLLIQTSPVQNFIKGKVVSYLKSKLHSNVSIGKIYITFPKNVVINDIYLEDQQHDTLFSAGKLSVNISMLKLLHSNVEINTVDLEKGTIKIKRLLPDTVFNFQFIVNAFSSASKNADTKKDTSSTQIVVHNITLDKINVVYKDVVTGNDVAVFLNHFNINIDEFDLQHQNFSAPTITISGLHGKIYQQIPLVNTVEKIDSTQISLPEIALKNINLTDIQLDYQNKVSAFSTVLNLNNFFLKAKQIDLTKKIISLDELELSKTSIAIKLGKSEEKKKNEIKDEKKSTDTTYWRVAIEKINLDENNIAFDNDNILHQKAGMDYSHIHLQNLTLHANDFLYANDTIAAQILKGEIKGQNSFELTDLRGEFLYSNKHMYVMDLVLKTPASIVNCTADLRYPSIQAINKNPSSLSLNINLPNGKLQIKDILMFVPALSKQAAFRDPKMILQFNTKMSGNLADLKIDHLQFSGFKNTHVDINGSIKGFPEINNTSANLAIHNINSTKQDLIMFFPEKSLPSNISIPDSLAIKGNIKGSVRDFYSDLTLNTSDGSISVKGNIKNANDVKNIIYDATLTTNKLNVGKVLRNENDYGEVTLQFAAKGKGVDMKTAQSQIEGTISSAEIKKYNYKNLKIKAGINNQIAKAEISMHDPNIDFSMSGSGDFHAKFPAVQFDLSINNIKANSLHLTKDNLAYTGVIHVNFPVTDPDHLQGEILIEKSLVIKDSQKIAIDSIKFLAGKTDTSQFLRLYADVIQAQLDGKYKLTEIGAVFKQLINPYFSTVSSDSIKTEPCNFRLTVNIINKPVLKSLFPSLQRLDPIHLAANFNSDKGWNANLISPMIVYGDDHIQNLQVHVKPESKKLNIETDIDQFKSGKSLALYGTSFKTSIADNKIDFVLNIHDKASKNKYNIAGLFQQPQKDEYLFSLKPDDLLLNYQRWQIDKNNSISFSSDAIHATEFNLSKGDEHLNINSENQEKNSPLDVVFNKFLLSTASAIAGTDSLSLNGLLNGKIVVNNIKTHPTFTSDLTIDDLSFYRDTVGNISLKVNNENQNKFSANVHITGKGNNIGLTGDYYTDKGNVDLNLDIEKLELNSIVGASMGTLKKASGSVSGKFVLKGTIDKPEVNGNIRFDNAMITPTSLSNDFVLDNQNIQIENDNIKFNNLTILDSVKNKLVLNGSVNTTDYKHYNFDLAINAKNFRALNSEKKDNQLFHGKLYFNCDLKVKGDELSPVVDGTIKIDEKTNLTIVVAQDEPGIEDRQGVIEFVNKKSFQSDSIVQHEQKDISSTTIKGLDISTNIIIDSSAVLNIVIDESNGDALTIKGKATLTGGVDQSGKTTLSGTYQISNGSYDLSFSLLKRNFKIQNGSTIVWTGEPTKANLNINAIMIANTAPIDLVDDQLAQSSSSIRNTYLQKLPFEVHLNIRGELLKPQISFDIVLPEDKSYSVSKDIITTVQAKLSMLRQDSGELNKQVFALLLLNRFVGEDPFATNTAGINAESLVRSSVSKILSQQLNQLATSLVKGVDVNFDLQSTDDYTTGQLQNRTDLNVMVSKRLLNDRLTVTVGSDFELEGPQNAGDQGSDLIGNIGADYKLSKDGRYMLRAYRKNDYDDIVEGYVIETGVGFIITVDYNKFKEIFRGKKKK